MLYNFAILNMSLHKNNYWQVDLLNHIMTFMTYPNVSADSQGFPELKTVKK